MSEYIKGWGAIVLLGSSLLPACADDDDAFTADVEGEYMVAITNGSNGCEFENYTVGESSTGTPFTLVQDGQAVTGTIEGIAGGVVELLLGTRTFEGGVSGDDIELTLFGERAAQQGNCSYTINATLTAKINGDALQGEINYTAKTNGNPDCEGLEGCMTRQDISGTRPPK